jgi:hypothetical protein
MKRSELKNLIREVITEEISKPKKRLNEASELDKLIANASPTELFYVVWNLTGKRIPSGDSNFRRDEDGGKERFLNYVRPYKHNDIIQALKKAAK